MPTSSEASRFEPSRVSNSSAKAACLVSRRTGIRGCGSEWRLAAQAAPRSSRRASRHSTVEPDGAAAGKIELDMAGRRVGLGEADGQQFEHAVDGIGVDAGGLHGGDAVEMQRGALALARLAALFPGETVHQQGKAAVGPGKAHVADAHHGVLGGGRDHFEIFAVERQQFQIGHGIGIRVRVGVSRRWSLRSRSTSLGGAGQWRRSCAWARWAVLAAGGRARRGVPPGVWFAAARRGRRRSAPDASE